MPLAPAHDRRKPTAYASLRADVERDLVRLGSDRSGALAEPVSHFVEDGPIRWHVTTMGRGPVMLLLHGTGASSHSLHPLMRRLADRFTLVAPDLPGHARTRAAPTFEPSLPMTSHALGRLVAALERAPAVVVGHSAGAALAARMTIDGLVRPRLLVGLAAALVPLRPLARAVLRPAAAVLSRSFAPAVIASLARIRAVDGLVRSTGSRLDRQELERYRRLVERPGHVVGTLSMMASWDLDPLHAVLPQLRTPCVLLAGRDDRAVPVDRLRAASARMPDATLVVIEGAGHLLHEEQPELVSALVLEHANRFLPPEHVTP